MLGENQAFGPVDRMGQKKEAYFDKMVIVKSIDSESANVSRNSRFNYSYILTYSAVQIKKSEMITTAM